MRKGSFQVILYKMIRFLSGKLKKHMKLAKIVKIDEIFDRLVFPLNFNRFCHPMTLFIEVANAEDLGKCSGCFMIIRWRNIFISDVTTLVSLIQHCLVLHIIT